MKNDSEFGGSRACGRRPRYLWRNSLGKYLEKMFVKLILLSGNKGRRIIALKAVIWLFLGCLCMQDGFPIKSCLILRMAFREIIPD